ncbi:MAG: M42 family metallopeptidase [Thermoleophilia bacterium]|nr:M42 family metallopeptidase [Thermoleophilia bacterium]
MFDDQLNWDLLSALCEVSAPSGREERVRDIVRPVLEETCDRVEVDPLGGLSGIRERGGAPKLMLAAHLDEIGLMVSAVDDSGFLRFVPLGGWDARTLVSQRVVVHGREDLPGVVGMPPVHLTTAADRNEAPKLEDLVIDLGLPRDEAKELTRPGDVVTRTRELITLGHLVTGKSLDDRVGLYVMLQALRATSHGEASLYATATAQEEVGLRGARVAAGRIDPDVAIAIDTCPAGDGPGNAKGGTTKLGDGAAIRVMDASAIGAPALVDHLEQLAKDRDIPYQFHVASKGGTDTQALQLSGTGAVAGCVSIPSRYVHSSVEVCHPADIEASVRLIAAAIETAHELVT